MEYKEHLILLSRSELAKKIDHYPNAYQVIGPIGTTFVLSKVKKVPVAWRTVPRLRCRLASETCRHIDSVLILTTPYIRAHTAQEASPLTHITL